LTPAQFRNQSGACYNVEVTSGEFMRPYYRYDPPRSNSNWLERLKVLTEPPWAYLVALGGIILGLILAARGSLQGYYLLILLIAFPIHELSHALVADRLGDPTPRRNGRITLNPLAQLNLIGSILMLLVGLGWAYVPINPAYLRPNPRTGHMLVAAAGPISNLLLAILMAVIYHISYTPIQMLNNPALNEFVPRLLYIFASINIALFLFNLVPIPPLDGFPILRGLLPLNLSYQLDRIQPYSFLIFMAVFFLAPMLGIPIISGLIFRPAQLLTGFLFGG
jgi:Zn-dependent protease